MSDVSGLSVMLILIAHPGWHVSGKNVRILATVALKLSVASLIIAHFVLVPQDMREMLMLLVLSVSRNQQNRNKIYTAHLTMFDHIYNLV